MKKRMVITTHNFSVLYALLKRDFFVMRKMILRDLIDSAIALFTNYLIYGVFFSAWGMDNQVVTVIFWGVCTLVLISNAFDQAFRYSLEGASGSIRQFLILPLSFRVFIARCIITSMMEQLLITVPFMVGGFILFSSFLSWKMYEVPGFILLYLSSLWCISALVVCLGFLFSLQWNRDNLWIRIIMPLSSLSPIYYDWSRAWAFSQWIGIIFLISPLSYITQGFRNVTLPAFFPTWVGISIIWCFALLFTFGAGLSVKRRIDAVVDL